MDNKGEGEEDPTKKYCVCVCPKPGIPYSSVPKSSKVVQKCIKTHK